MIERLTDQQWANIHRDRLALQRNPFRNAKFDKEITERILVQYYSQLGKDTPKFYYVASPKAALKLINELTGESQDTYHYPFHYGISELSWIEFYRILDKNVEEIKFDGTLLSDLDTFRSLVLASGWTYTFETFVVVCEHPVHAHFNDEFRLNKVNGKAIEYSDGYGVYAFDGVRVPEKFGGTDPESWDPKEVISEPNAEVRRALIQVLGYEKIISSLGAETLDTWREYSLVKVSSIIDDEEDFVLLKMTCPSTEHVHVLRVPPTSTSARGAATWVNHGIDPNEFLVEH